MRVKVGNVLTKDAATLEFGDGGTVTELDGHVTVSNGGSLTSAAYRLVSDGSTVTAYDVTGVAIASSPDGGVAFTACLPAAGSQGATIAFRNDGHVFPWGSTPLLPKGITGRLCIQGNGSLVQGSAGGPSFLGCNRTADYDTFQNIWIDNILFDANNVVGKYHVLFGDVAVGNSTTMQRLNFANIHISNCVAVNIPFDSNGVNTRRGVWLVSNQLATGETQTSVTNILIDNVRLAGGNVGFVIGGTSAAATANGFTVLSDNITIRRCYHDTLNTPTATTTSSNYQIGSKGYGGRCTIVNCEGYNSWDVGIEVDAMTTALVDNVKIENSRVPFYHTNIGTPVDPKAQSVTFRKCSARYTNYANAASPPLGFSWFVNASTSVPLGKITLDDCDFYKASTVTLWGANNTTGEGINGVNDWQEVEINNFRYISDNNYSAVGAVTPYGISISGGNALSRVTIRNPYFNITGARQGGAGNVIITGIRLGGTLVSPQVIGGTFRCSVTGLANNSTRGIYLGVGGSSTITGEALIDGFVIAELPTDTQPNGVRIESATNLTLSKLIVTHCDFTPIPATGKDINFVNSPDNVAAVLAICNKRSTVPVPANMTGLATGTGLALSAAVVTSPCIVTFKQATGTAITAIDYSTNGGTTYTNLLTQASGALPGGFDQSLGPLNPDALIKVTFTGTQPTITLVPVNP